MVKNYAGQHASSDRTSRAFEPVRGGRKASPYFGRKCPAENMRKCEEYAQMLSYGYIGQFFDKKFAVIRQHSAFSSVIEGVQGEKM
jgi:hypothetical protein